MRADGLADQPEFHIEIDQAKAGALGLAPADINDTLSSALGGSYVNDFINKGRVKKVYMQADAPFRMQPGDIGNWHVRNRSGEMVPLSAFATGIWTCGPPRLERYNGARHVALIGEAGPGVSTGDAMQAVERLMAQLPAGIGYEWSGRFLPGDAWPARRRRCCMPSRSCSCSCASRRCMRAGRCPSR